VKSGAEIIRRQILLAPRRWQQEKNTTKKQNCSFHKNFLSLEHQDPIAKNRKKKYRGTKNRWQQWKKTGDY
jgi:hypothetical protein